MDGNVYALLIAVDKYSSPVPALNGCVRDSLDVKEYLEANVPSDRLKLKVLHDENATKEGIIDGFLSHLTQARENDAVFIHYSGHGSQEKAPEAFWYMEPDKMNETLVCYDSRQVINGVYHRDLADKELGALIHKVSEYDPHIIMIMDCCHSGSGTRDTKKVTARQSPSDKETSRSLDDYVFMRNAQFDKTIYQKTIAGKDIKLPQGKHILLAGCKSKQTAKELSIGGKTGGVFTYSLLQALKKSQGNLSYRDLLKRAAAYVKNTVADQDPQLNILGKGDSNLTFLSGAARNDAEYFTVHYAEGKGWMVDAGSLNGIPASSSGQVTMAIYSENTNIKEKPGNYLYKAKVTTVQPGHSIIEFDDGQMMGLSKDAKFKATILELPMEKTRYFLEAEKPEDRDQVAALEKVRNALKVADAGNVQKYIEEVSSVEEAEYRVRAYKHEGEEKYSIHKPYDNQPLMKQIIGFNDKSAEEVVKNLAGVGRYDRTFELANPATQIPPKEVEIEVFVSERDRETGEFGPEKKAELDASGEIPLPYYTYDTDDEDDYGISPRVRIKVTNHSPSQTYHTALLYMGSNFEISNILDGKTELGPGQYIYAIDGEYFVPEIAEGLLKMGLVEDFSSIKLLASSASFDPQYLEQKGFDYPVSFRDVDKDPTGEISGFQALMQETKTRGLRRKSKKKTVPVDWTTDHITIRPILTDMDGDAILAKSGVKVEGPTGVKVSVSSLSNSTRSTESGGGPFIPPILLEDSDLARPVVFAHGQGLSPDLNIIELSGIEDTNAVNADNPLKITLEDKMEPGEGIMAVVQEGDLVFPVMATQQNGKTEISLDSLPDPVPTGTRGLGKTFKLLLHKVFSGKLGVSEFTYPRLGIVSQNEDDWVELDFDPIRIRREVATASKIMLVIHGFTSECVECFFGPSAKQGDKSFYHELKDSYNLVLAFDYESYNTKIENSAADLERVLREAGLGEGHGNTLHILSHSMGGLVSRYFIERLNGDKIVSHLILAGTPNGGSPWPQIKDWALMSSTLLLNNIPVVGWGLSALGFMLNGTRGVDMLDRVTEDMKRGSDFLTRLEKSDDPGVPYTLLAGNTTAIPDDPETRSKVGRILARLKISDTDNLVTNLLFGKSPNDMAVSVDSITSLPSNREPAPRTEAVSCNHFAYFAPGDGLEKLMEVIKTVNAARIS